MKIAGREEVVGEVVHGSIVATFASGQRLIACRCREVVHENNWRSHIAAHRRESIVYRASRLSNVEMNGRDFLLTGEVVRGIPPAEPIRVTRRRRSR